MSLSPIFCALNKTMSQAGG